MIVHRLGWLLYDLTILNLTWMKVVLWKGRLVVWFSGCYLSH